ncbi:unnamed protein product [Lactuca virosa]|uniref:Uncharacterized protein n=1 Tax=Lactuca virosa TaxID=75947 RepID=A0AAU9PCD7_9ASTR|nr:unnamed protein product [Lactuca virosa]
MECIPSAVKVKSITDRSRHRKIATSFVATLIPSGEEVINIHDDDIHQSEWVQGASKKPTVDKDPSETTPAQCTLSNQTKSFAASEMSDYDDHIFGIQCKNHSSNKIFAPKWNLTDESRISSQEVTVEFSHHAFPKENVAELEAFWMNGRLTLWILILPKAPSSFVMELGTSYPLRAELDNTLKKNKGLSIRVEILERELLDKDKLLFDSEAEVARIGSELVWLIKEGVVRIVEKVIELPEIFQGVGRFKHMCWAAGEESAREALCKEVVVGRFDPHVANSTSSHTGERVDSIESFITYDYNTLMNLGSMDINNLHQLCADDDSGGAGPSGTEKIIGLDGGTGK